jgi:hypothetical protein
VHRKKLVKNPEEKRPFGKPGHRWKNNIRMDLNEIGCVAVDCIHLTQNKDQWQILLNNLEGSIKDEGFLD